MVLTTTCISAMAMVVSNGQPISCQQDWQQKQGGPIERGFPVHPSIILLALGKFNRQIYFMGKKWDFFQKCARQASETPVFHELTANSDCG